FSPDGARAALVSCHPVAIFLDCRKARSLRSIPLPRAPVPCPASLFRGGAPTPPALRLSHCSTGLRATGDRTQAGGFYLEPGQRKTDMLFALFSLDDETVRRI